MNESISGEQEIIYTLSRAQWLGGWWSWAAVVVALAVLVYLMIRLYRRDTYELDRGTRWTLIFLRLTVIAGLVFFLLGIERRARQRVTRPSEVAVLVDTSQSMSQPQSDQAGAQRRIDVARQLVADSPLVHDLAQAHRVTVYTFDTTGELNEVLVSNLDADTLAAQDDPSAGTDDPSAATSENSGNPTQIRPRSIIAIVAAFVLLAALLMMLVATAMRWFAGSTSASYLLLTASVLFVIGTSSLGLVWSIRTEATLGGLLGITAGQAAPTTDRPEDVDQRERLIEETIDKRMELVDWEGALDPKGTETRIGDALRSTLTRHDPATLAAIVLLTDGQNNGGTPAPVVASLIARGGGAIFPIGFGSAKPPVDIRIVDFDAPRRVYPGDKFAVGAVLQGSGNEPLQVKVSLIDSGDSASADGSNSSDEASSAADESAADGANSVAASAGTVIDSKDVLVPGDGSLIGVQFEMEPKGVGKRRLTLKVEPPVGVVLPSQDDANERRKKYQREARYEVVGRRLRTLLVAGGPMREYRFVRNLLYRDDSVEVDVWLQTGQQGMSQDADRMLDAFPDTAEALYEYDAILAFDPDWTLLDANQLQLIDTWLSQQAGGLVLISGPVYMPEWMKQRTDPRVELVRDFFPVRLPTRGALLSAGRVGGDTSWPLSLTPDGLRADFLKLDDDNQLAASVWKDFGGVYDYVGVHEAKPAAKIYAYFDDPSAAIDQDLPIYFASQFYGAGRVFFQGSGEMWRLRGLDVSYFDAYYTKLIRWVSEGRLMRDSNRGILLVDRPRAMVGDTITVRAILTDEQFQPLRVPQVEAKLLTPGGDAETVRLTPLAGEPREGTYTGRFLIRDDGLYELRLALGDALSEEVLTQTIQASQASLEAERPTRNDEVLNALAATTGGAYVPLDASPLRSSDPSATKIQDPLQIPAAIEPQSQLTILPGTPDRDFQRRHNATLMWLLCSLLTMEWMVRRLNRLA